MKRKDRILTLCLAALLAVLCHRAEAGESLGEYSVAKTFIRRMEKALAVDRDSLPALIREAEILADTATDAPSAALLHSMTAEMYQAFFRQNRGSILRRTPLEGFIPEDMREWTQNLFTQKIREQLAASLKPEDLLRQTPASILDDDVMERGKDSPALRPTLYDFLAHRALEIQPSEEIYRELLTFRRTQPNPRAALVVELDYLQYLGNRSEADRQTCEASIDSLLKLHAGKDYSVEAACAKLQLLQRKRFSAESPDSIRTLEYELCREMTARYPHYERIGLVKNHLASLEEKELRAMSNYTVYPGKNLEIRLYYTNIRKATVKVYRGDLIQTQKLKVKEIPLVLPLRNSYTAHDTLLSIPAGKVGAYAYEVVADSLCVGNNFGVSRLAVVVRSASSSQSFDVVVTDYLSGKPLSGASVHCYDQPVPKQGTAERGVVKTDVHGLASIPADEKIVSCIVRFAEDAMPASLHAFHAGNTSLSAHPEVRVHLFTDRGVYRPGQTVFFKGIAYMEDKEHARVRPNQRIEVLLRDVGNEVVATRWFTTNSFGSFSGEFVLPSPTLTGVFSLSAANRSVDLRVEEYKRPTFRVELLPVREGISFGDEVSIRGKAQTFSGAALVEGRVVYRILRRPFFFRTSLGSLREEQVAEGETTIDGNGNFAFVFRPEKSGKQAMLSFQSYEIITRITDSKGETQQAGSSFSVGDRSFLLHIDLPERVNKDTAKVRITAYTPNGDSPVVHGSYALFALEDTPTEGFFSQGRKLREGEFTSARPLPPALFFGLTSARVRLRVSATDDKGRQVSRDSDFILYGSDDKRPPVFSDVWLLPHREECAPGEEVVVRFGSSHRKVYLLYEVFADGKTLLQRRHVRLSNENLGFRILFPENNTGELTLSFTFVKEGKLHTQQTAIVRRRPDRSLVVRAETFRDKLLPGSRESWKFRVSDARNLPVTAEVLAGMYDASLDAVYPFAWHFAPKSRSLPPLGVFRPGEGLRLLYDSDLLPPSQRQTPDFAFDRLDWQGAWNSLLPLPRNVLYATAQPALAESLSPAFDALSLRTDFRETAFFFPALQTDEQGYAVLNFTLPESNTTWKLQILAHTPDLHYGLSTHRLVTQKPLMTLPRLPRFLTEGDEAHLSAQIINLSDQETRGTARLEIFNPATGQEMLPLETRPFSLSAGGTTTVSWSVALFGKPGMAGVRILAESDLGSDGEQHLLPVLPDRILLTESTPFYLSGEETEKQVRVNLPPPSPTLLPAGMTLEFTDNPAGYALHSLPALSEPYGKDVVSLFASYYAGMLAGRIACERPREANLRELLRRQHETGGWGWLEGFRPSREITLYLLEGMAQLADLKLASYSPQERDMQIKAVQYIDREFGEDYARQPKTGLSLPSPPQVHYLYVRSAYEEIPPTGHAAEALRYYTEQVEKHWRKASLNEKGEIALLMHRRGKAKLAEEILDLLRETAVTSPEKGMFWPNNRREQNYFRSPIDVHCLLMTVFRTLGASASETDRLRQWLLNRKQTRHWGSTPSTLYALYSLLGSESDSPMETNETSIRWGDKTFSPTVGETGAGYMLESVEGDSLRPSHHSLVLHKKGNSPAWGAVFYQYFESVEKINAQRGALSVEKKLFRETRNGPQRQITPIDAATPLARGDKLIVRLTLGADRDMDYVLLQDFRAACLEAGVQSSGLRLADRLICYHSPGDESENFYFEHLPQGRYVLEYATYVARSGRYGGGIATLQCLYAPEFISHTQGSSLWVEK
ncbi:MAG: alpha-2-macroglobulin [Tannerellaceae bacterium]|jgi:hypothetical protein|nr:alpha-2-macroglobulin [Tannerellaceae bacterium]